MKEKIEAITLTTKESTKIMADIIADYEDMSSNWTYKAPEVIKSEINNFLWNLYIAGRIDEKEAILKVI